MSHILVSALLMSAQVAALPSGAPPTLDATQSAVVLPITLPFEPRNCALEVRATDDSANAAPTKIKYLENGQVRIDMPLAENESTRQTADVLIQLDKGWYAQGRASLYRVGSPDNDPAMASAPYLGMSMEPDFVIHFAAAKTMQFWDNTSAWEQYNLGAVAKAKFDAWTECIKNLPVTAVATTPYPVYFRRQTPLQPVTPINKHSWITGDDYPPSAMRAELQGTVEYTLTVGVNGRVQDCAMTRNESPTITPSVNDVPELNQATCRNIARRARFAPATDAEGRPLEANYSGRVRWALPNDPPPPAMPPHRKQ